MKRRKRLNEILPENPGILATINASFPLNFFDDTTQEGRNRIAAMDYDYIWSNSGEKLASLIAEKQYDEDTETLDMTKLSKIIGMRYAEKWNLMWEALTVEYDILENYNRTETESTDREATETDGLKENVTESVADTEGQTGTITDVLDGEVKDSGTVTDVLDGEVKDSGTVTDVLDGETNNTGTDNLATTRSTTRTENETIDGDLFGFNSSNASNADKSTRDYDDSLTETGSDNRTLNTKVERDDTNTRTLNTTTETDNTNTKTLNTTTETDNTNTRTLNTTKTNNHTANNSKASDRTGRTVEDITRRLTVAGNIGVMSNEQMQEQRLLLLNKWFEFYQNVVYRDIDNILALSIY